MDKATQPSDDSDPPSRGRGRTRATRAKAESRARRDKPAAHPLGRGLANLEPLTGPEKFLLECVGRGMGAKISPEVPSRPDDGNRVRAEFLRVLCKGDPAVEIDLRGINLHGAYIEGKLDLAECVVPLPVRATDCYFEEDIVLYNASFSTIILTGSKLQSIDAYNLRVKHDFLIRDKSVVFGTINLSGAEIGGDLSLKGCHLVLENGSCLRLDRARIYGSVFLSKGFRAIGRSNLVGTCIKGSLVCSDATFSSLIQADNLIVERDVVMDESFECSGGVRLLGCLIAGDLNCASGRFLNPEGVALNLRSGVIKGAFIWAEGARAEGSIWLESASCGVLIDEHESWRGATYLVLNGFQYQHIAGHTTASEASPRIDWLAQQNENEPFRPQPWEHLIKVLREMGNLEDAKIVAIEKQRQMASKGVIGSRTPREDLAGISRVIDRIWTPVSNRLARALHSIYGGLAGYGYRPLKTVGWMLLSWMLGSLVYWSAAGDGMFGPTNVRIYTDGNMVACGTGGDVGKTPWTSCEDVPAEYPAFNPLIYSLDLSLPVVDLHQESEWAPLLRSHENEKLKAGWLIRLFMWAQIVFGWLTSLLLVSALGRLIQGDK